MRSHFPVGLPGLEPGKAGPESAVLPLHHSPRDFHKVAAKVHTFCESTKLLAQKIYKTIKNLPFRSLIRTFVLHKIEHQMYNTDLLIDKIVKGIQEKKGRNVTIVDLSPIEDTICRAFVICTANSPSHVQALTDSIIETARKEAGSKPMAVDGLRNALWVAMDYADVMVHIFLPETRDFYDLEHLWADAGLTEIPDVE